MRFTVPFVLAFLVPVWARNFFVWLQARRDAQFGWYASVDVITRWLGKRVAWNAAANPTHRRVEAALTPPPECARWVIEQDRVDKEIAKRPPFWVLVSAFFVLFVADVLGDVQLLKSLDVEAGPRRVLMAVAVAAVLFALPLFAVHLSRAKKGKPSLWFWPVLLVLGVLATVIGILQVGESRDTQDYAAAFLLGVAVVGPAMLAKPIAATALDVWPLRRESQRLGRKLGRARHELRVAQRYVDDFQRYAHWYDSQAAQIRSVYRRAFARKYLKVHGHVEKLEAFLTKDTFVDYEEALSRPGKATMELVTDEQSETHAEQQDSKATDEMVSPYRRRRS